MKMAEKKSKRSLEEQQRIKQVRAQLNALRGVLAVGAAAVVMELGNGKVMAQPDFDRKVEPVTQNAPQPAPDNTPTAEWPGLGATPQSMPEAPAPVVDDRPAGINIPAAEPPAPEIRVGEEEDVPYDYEDARKTCDDEHYDICNDLLGECEDAGYGKQELDYETKLDLAVGATEVEMSKLLGEEMLPALDGVVQMTSGMESVLANYGREDQNDPIVRAKINRDVKNVDKSARKAAGKAMKSYRKMLKLAQESGRIHKLAEKYAKTGEKADEKMLDNKIKGMYEHAQDFTRKYEKENFEKSGRNNSVSLSAAQQKMVKDSLSR